MRRKNEQADKLAVEAARPDAAHQQVALRRASYVKKAVAVQAMLIGILMDRAREQARRYGRTKEVERRIEEAEDKQRNELAEREALRAAVQEIDIDIRPGDSENPEEDVFGWGGGIEEVQEEGEQAEEDTSDVIQAAPLTAAADTSAVIQGGEKSRRRLTEKTRLVTAPIAEEGTRRRLTEKTNRTQTIYGRDVPEQGDSGGASSSTSAWKPPEDSLKRKSY